MPQLPNADYDLFQLSEEHQALREAVRALAVDRIAPRAAEIDETGEFPQDVYESLVAAGFHAIHIPEAYGGEGGDQLAACIVAEEIARVCGSSSLIPAVNKLGTTPLLVGGSEELKQRYLSQVASGDAMFSYALSEREAGSDAASMKTRAVRDGDDFVLNGQKSWITNAGTSEVLHGGLWPRPTPRRAPGVSRRSWCTTTIRVSHSARRSASLGDPRLTHS